MKKKVYVFLTQPKNPELAQCYQVQGYDLPDEYRPEGWQRVPGVYEIEFEPIAPAPAAEQAIQNLNKKLGELEMQAIEIKREIASFLAITHEVS